MSRTTLRPALVAVAARRQMRRRVMGRVGVRAAQEYTVDRIEETARVYLQRAQQVLARVRRPSQRSLHNAPIFRLLLKVAVKGTHQCDFFNFCGALAPTRLTRVLDRGSERMPPLSLQAYAVPQVACRLLRGACRSSWSGRRLPHAGGNGNTCNADGGIADSC